MGGGDERHGIIVILVGDAIVTSLWYRWLLVRSFSNAAMGFERSAKFDFQFGHMGLIQIQPGKSIHPASSHLLCVSEYFCY